MTVVRPALLGVVASALLAGCAALTVDVDVYKGPLANELHVQTQQVAVMAIGAKPLLEELQIRLNQKAVAACDDSEKTKQIQRLAARVRDVLSLYDDLRPTALETKLKEVQEIAYSANDALRRYLRSSSDECASEWSTYKNELRREARIANTPLAMLAHGYERLLDDRATSETDPKSSDGKGLIIPVFKAHLDLARENAAIAKVRLFSGDADVQEKRDAEEIPANEISGVLERREVVAAHAEVLFPDDADALRKQFVDAVTGVARGFREVRFELRRLMRAMAEALVVAHGGPWTLTAKDLVELDGALTNGIADLISPDALLEVARLKTDLPGISGLHAELKTCLVENAAATKNLKDERDRAKASLKKFLLAKPAEHATELLRADELFPSEAFAAAMRDDSSAPTDDPHAQHVLKKYRNPEWRKVGMSAGSGSDRAQAGVARGTLMKLNAAVGLITNSFRRGRLDDGIETLLEKYLKEANDKCCEADPAPCARQRLMRCLVQFSEKLRFLANNISFVVDDTADTARFRTVLEAVANTIQVHVNELDRAAPNEEQVRAALEREEYALESQGDEEPCIVVAHFLESMEDGKRKAVAAAEQAVKDAEAANLAKGAADAKCIALKAASDKADDEAAIAAKEAVDAKGSRSIVQKTFATLLEKDGVAKEVIALVLRGSSVDLPKFESLPSNRTARDVLDQLIAFLRHAEVRALADDAPDAGRVQRIRNAIQAALEQRSGMIYLRPTSAYLRTSYAVSALGSNAGSGWHNMLNDSLGAFIPLIGEDYRNGIFDPETRKIAADRDLIDRQFWQSINHVRVSGGGRTNYVVVKDDLGNWYVKGYSSDPQKVIESAKNVALFNAGPARAALLKRGGNAKAVTALGGGTGAPSDTILGGQLKRVEATYEKSTRESRVDVHDQLVATIGTDGKAAWDADRGLDAYRTELAAALAAGDPQLADAKKSIPGKETVPEAGDAIVAGLLAVKRYRSTVVAAVDREVVAPRRDKFTSAHADVTTKQQASNAAERELSDAIVALDALGTEPEVGVPETETHRTWAADRARLDTAKRGAQAKAKQAKSDLDAALQVERDRATERDAAQAAATTANRLLTDLVATKLTERIEKRQKAIGEYDAAIALIGGSVTK